MIICSCKRHCGYRGQSTWHRFTFIFLLTSAVSVLPKGSCPTLEVAPNPRQLVMIAELSYLNQSLPLQSQRWANEVTNYSYHPSCKSSVFWSCRVRARTLSIRAVTRRTLSPMQGKPQSLGLACMQYIYAHVYIVKHYLRYVVFPWSEWEC